MLSNTNSTPKPVARASRYPSLCNEAEHIEKEPLIDGIVTTRTPEHGKGIAITRGQRGPVVKQAPIKRGQDSQCGTRCNKPTMDPGKQECSTVIYERTMLGSNELVGIKPISFHLQGPVARGTVSGTSDVSYMNRLRYLVQPASTGGQRQLGAGAAG